MKHIFCVLLLGTFSIAHAQTSDSIFNKQSVLSIMQRVADWQLNDYATNGFKHRAYDWTNAACYTGLFELSRMNGGEKYSQFLVAVGDSLNWNTGPRKGHADDYCIGQTYSNLFMKYKDPKMIAKFRQQADSLAAAPHDESLEWKNKIGDREWAWCDALFMGPTALSYLSTATGDPKYLNLAIRLWWKTTGYLYDHKEHLYFRDQTFFDKKENNGAKVFWSRGNGWVLAGLVRVIDNIPQDDPQRKDFIKLYKDMSERIADLQQPDGSWHASLLDPASYPAKETSGTGFYTYALLWGINKGILKKKNYWPVVEKGWKALVNSVHPDGMLGFVQAIGAAPGHADETTTEVYGVGAFLLAGSEMYKAVPPNPPVSKTR